MRLKLRTVLLYLILIALLLIVGQQYSHVHRERIPVIEIPKKSEVKVMKKQVVKDEVKNQNYVTLFNHFRRAPNDSDTVLLKRIQIQRLTIQESWQVIQKMNHEIDMDSSYLETQVIKPWWFNFPKTPLPILREKPRDPKSPTPKDFFRINHDVNRRDFRYLINQPHICNVKDMYLLIAIMSEPSSTPMRMAIRSTWGRLMQAYGQDVRIVFMLGATGSSYHQSLIEAEASQYHDIVQESFYEAYNKLTDKAIMMLKWASKFCSNAEYVLKINDNVIINPYKVVKYLQKQTPRDLYWGKVVYLDTPQDKIAGQDHYASNVTWTGKTFPPYCARPHIIMSIDTVHKFYLMSRRTPWVFPDDIYYGILAEKLGILPFDYSKGIGKIQYGLDPADILGNWTSPLLIVETHDSGQMTNNQHRYWSVIQQGVMDRHQCVLNQQEILPVSLGDVFIET